MDTSTASVTTIDSKPDAVSRPDIMAGIIGGIIVGVICAFLLVLFIVCRMRKKDEGSYALDEPIQQQSPNHAYQRAPTTNKEFYA